MKMVNCSIQMGRYSRDAKYTTICLMGDILGGVQRKMISAPTENGKKVLTMTEYIEREAISEEIRKYYYKNPPNSSYGEGFDRGL